MCCEHSGVSVTQCGGCGHLFGPIELWSLSTGFGGGGSGNKLTIDCEWWYLRETRRRGTRNCRVHGHGSELCRGLETVGIESVTAIERGQCCPSAANHVTGKIHAQADRVSSVCFDGSRRMEWFDCIRRDLHVLVEAQCLGTKLRDRVAVAGTEPRETVPRLQ